MSPRSAIVLGGGNFARSVAMSLLANCTRRVTMVLRDPNCLDEFRSSSALTAFGGSVSLLLPRGDCSGSAPSPLEVCLFRDVGAPQHVETDVAFLCTPISALRNVGVGEASSSRSENPRAVLDIVAQLQRHRSPTSPLLWIVGTRGLARDGSTPLQLLNQHLSTAASVHTGVVHPLRAAVMQCMGVPKEWALRSVQLWLEEHERRRTSTATAASADSLSVVSLCFAESSGVSSDASSAGALVGELFPAENISWIGGNKAAAAVEVVSSGAPHCSSSGSKYDDADLLGLVNALTMVVTFGAGMVSNEYPTVVSASLSYFHHAMTATEDLLRQLLRSASSPAAAEADGRTQNDLELRIKSLMTAVAPALMLCTVNHGAKEYILGRQMKSQFRKHDAQNATFGFRQHSALESLEDTMIGLYAIIRRHGLVSPFYLSLIDAYETQRRADDVGKQLIRTGWYSDSLADQRDAHPESMLSLMQRADAAVESGDGLEEAAAAMMSRFGSAVPPTHAAKPRATR